MLALDILGHGEETGGVEGFGNGWVYPFVICGLLGKLVCEAACNLVVEAFEWLLEHGRGEDPAFAAIEEYHMGDHLVEESSYLGR